MGIPKARGNRGNRTGIDWPRHTRYNNGTPPSARAACRCRPREYRGNVVLAATQTIPTSVGLKSGAGLSLLPWLSILVVPSSSYSWLAWAAIRPTKPGPPLPSTPCCPGWPWRSPNLTSAKPARLTVAVRRGSTADHHAGLANAMPADHRSSLFGQQFRATTADFLARHAGREDRRVARNKQFIARELERPRASAHRRHIAELKGA